jgi:hypothetical protein
MSGPVAQRRAPDGRNTIRRCELLRDRPRFIRADPTLHDQFRAPEGREQESKQGRQ